MNKYSFLDDYSEGCHASILTAMTNVNLVQQTAYGEDEYTSKAKVAILRHLESADSSIWFVASGTLANIIVIASCLRSHEAVVAANTGHIVVRETGAIEATGHKIITMSTSDGKLSPTIIQAALDSNSHYPHMAKPRLVYISNATELGTVYTRAELSALSEFCKSKELLLFLDGARLGVALSADKNDLTLSDIARMTDIFWIGGTKAGALLGEAIVINDRGLADDISFHIKQRGALLAKGRLLGIQFLELFKAELFFEASRHANAMAAKLSSAMDDGGFRLAAVTESNQVFPIMPNPLIEHLKKHFDFYVWEKLNTEESIIRLVTSWATEEGEVDRFIHEIGNYIHPLD
ncbi:MAG: aminotransferase class I/II-fold pyridoxal phosphate-dependent enzyme [Granulosicoccus sp.]|nr:aminotransferase class I/II-fold pyridoxal phosphate-dependent enzyme [Granulosicoccus sp.]